MKRFVAVYLVLGGIAVAPLGARGSTCSYWAAPHADPAPPGVSGPAGSETNPFEVIDFWSRAEPGDTLCLKDGVYTKQSGMIKPPPNLSGRAEAPITVRAVNDGGVLIDGGLRSGSSNSAPVSLRHNDHFVLEGFNAANSNTAVIAISGGWDQVEARTHLIPEGYRPIRNVTLRRIVAWNANPRFEAYRACRADPSCKDGLETGGFRANFHVVDIAAARNVLLEDVAGFGTGRKVFQVFLSEHVTLRRVWGRWEGNATTHTQTFSCAYRSYSSICENVIGTWSGQQQDPTIEIARQLKTVLGMDWFKATDRWQEPTDPFDSGLRVLGSLAYVTADARVPPKNAMVFGYGKNQTLRDLVSYMAPELNGRHALNLTGCTERVDCSWQRGRGRLSAPLRAGTITAIGGDGGLVIHPDWRRWKGFGQPKVYAPTEPGTPDIFTGDGARICHRFQDGRLTRKPLWPWPMNERIKAATLNAHGVATDVQAEIEALFGPIPTECKTQPADAAASIPQPTELLR